MISELRERLEQVAQRFRRVCLWRNLAVCWLVLAVLGASYAYWMSRRDREWIPATFLTAWAMIALGAYAFGAGFARKSARDTRWVARRIEAKYPDLKAGLLTAIEHMDGSEFPKTSPLAKGGIEGGWRHRPRTPSGSPCVQGERKTGGRRAPA